MKHEKNEEKIENLCKMLEKVERTIAELSRVYAKLPDSKHYNVGGRMKPTLKQEVITGQLKQAQDRASRLMRMIEKLQKE